MNLLPSDEYVGLRWDKSSRLKELSEMPIIDAAIKYLDPDVERREEYVQAAQTDGYGGVTSVSDFSKTN